MQTPTISKNLTHSTPPCPTSLQLLTQLSQAILLRRSTFSKDKNHIVGLVTIDTLLRDLPNRYLYALEDLAPSGPLEISLAERIVIGFWKLRRVTWLEKEYYNFAMDFGVEGATGLVNRTFRDIEAIQYTGGVKSFMGIPLDAIKAPGDLAYTLFNVYHVLGNFRRYESEIDRSLYRTIAELDRRKAAARKQKEAMSAELRKLLN